MLYVPTILPAAMMSSSYPRTGLLRISNSPVTPANLPVPPRICPFNGTVVPNGMGDAVFCRRPNKCGHARECSLRCHSDWSECHLRAHRECVEPGAGVSGVGRANLLTDVAVQVVEHETHVAIDVPVQARGVDCLLSTGHTICGPQLIVQIHGADAAGNFPRTPTAAPQREWICRDDAAVGCGGRNIG